MSKWTFENAKGEIVSWYSADVIEKIEEYCNVYSENTILRPVFNDILRIIEEGEKNEV